MTDRGEKDGGGIKSFKFHVLIVVVLETLSGGGGCCVTAHRAMHFWTATCRLIRRHSYQSGRRKMQDARGIVVCSSNNLERRVFQRGWRMHAKHRESNALRFTVSTLFSFGGDHAQQRQMESFFPKRKVFVPFPVPNSVLRSRVYEVCQDYLYSSANLWPCLREGFLKHRAIDSNRRDSHHL